MRNGGTLSLLFSILPPRCQCSKRPPRSIPYVFFQSAHYSIAIMATTSLDLPLEIAELIIDETANAGDKETLKNVSMASRRYTNRCQRHLLHTVNLGDRCIPGGEYYKRLRLLLARSPALGEYVKELYLVDTYVWDRAKDVNWGWLIAEDGLADVLALLPNLTTFSIRFNAQQPAWPSFVPALRHALIQLAQRPKVQTFALSRIGRFPSSLLITLAASVRQLELTDLSVQEFTPAAPLEVVLGVAAIANPIVEVLTLRAPKAAMLHVLRTILSVAPRSMLRRLRVTMMDHTDEAAALELWSLLHWASNSIRELEWLPAVRPPVPATLPPPPITLAILTRLTSLHFLVNFHAPAPVFAALLPLLGQVSSGSYFRRLTIECMFIQPVELVACQRDWAALDSILCTSAFDGLKEVVFVARRRSSPDQLRKQMLSAGVVLEEMLPLARAGGVRVWFDRQLH